MIAERSDRRQAFLGLAAVFLSLCAAAWVLWRFPPEQYGFYPVCPVREYLHVECPGCGATRAMAALLHGQWAQALRLNGLVVGVVLPLGMLYACVGFARFARGGEFRWPVVPRAGTFALLGLAVVFTVARNL